MKQAFSVTATLFAALFPLACLVPVAAGAATPYGPAAGAAATTSQTQHDDAMHGNDAQPWMNRRLSPDQRAGWC